MHNDTFPTPDVWLEHRVSYGETDAMGFVYHAEYLHIFERSRGAYLRSLGSDRGLVPLPAPGEIRRPDCCPRGHFRAGARVIDLYLPALRRFADPPPCRRHHAPRLHQRRRKAHAPAGMAQPKAQVIRRMRIPPARAYKPFGIKTSGHAPLKPGKTLFQRIFMHAIPYSCLWPSLPFSAGALSQGGRA